MHDISHHEHLLLTFMRVSSCRAALFLSLSASFLMAALAVTRDARLRAEPSVSLAGETIGTFCKAPAEDCRACFNKCTCSRQDSTQGSSSFWSQSYYQSVRQHSPTRVFVGRDKPTSDRSVGRLVAASCACWPIAAASSSGDNALDRALNRAELVVCVQMG